SEHVGRAPAVAQVRDPAARPARLARAVPDQVEEGHDTGKKLARQLAELLQKLLSSCSLITDRACRKNLTAHHR
ncbi:MAG: hypothetical protein L0220_04305, partial [Acidobacteria bacterium]|nr:hypothetical protein [Acidobacteriota bacterium]